MNTIEETIVDDNQSSKCQEFMSQLEQLMTCSTTTKESKKQVWVQFISLWCEILQIPSTDAQTWYHECARILPILLKSTSFYIIKKELFVARETFCACISHFNQSHMKAYLQLTTEQRKLAENRIYYTHVYHLLMIATQTTLSIPFLAIEDRQFIDNHSEFVITLIESVERSMSEQCQTIEQKEHALGVINERILALLWNLSDRTVLIPVFLKCGLAKQVVMWLSQAAMLTDKGRRPLISIAYNIGRHDEGGDELNKFGAIAYIKQSELFKI
ncbi:unnamed protein product [Rotaria sp. Silwood1]|nr:unnamed protein product [Rotaria sp. Silwood1]